MEEVFEEELMLKGLFSSEEESLHNYKKNKL